jgi:CRISPR-associated protein Csm4
MPEYRIEIRLEGPVATPLHSGTLFGHLCWALRNDSEATLEAWLSGLEESPFLISDAFPCGWLPAPLLAPARREKPAGFEHMQKAKKLRKAGWLRVQDFLEIRGALSRRALEERMGAGQPTPPTVVRTARNSINRLTGTTPDSGGLFFVDEMWPNADERREIWVSASESAEWLEARFREIGTLGYGADASVGRGRFTVRVEPAPADLFHAPGNRCVSLSHGSLTANMGEPRYRLHTHFGKLGSIYASGGDPFKRPLVLLRPGATFRPEDGGPFGELLHRVHSRRPEVCHNAWHLVAPFTEKQEVN